MLNCDAFVVIVFPFSVDECKDTLIQFGVQDITPSSVARVIGENSSMKDSVVSCL